MQNMFLEIYSSKLFKTWFAGYLIGVALACLLFGFQKGQIFWRNPDYTTYFNYLINSDTNEGYAFKRRYWLTDDFDDTPPLPPEVHGIKYLVHINEAEDRSLSNMISARVRVFCFVMTISKYHGYILPRQYKQLRYLKKTWGKRCDKFLFVSTEPDKTLPAIGLKSNLDDRWSREKEALRYVYDNHENDADWFLRADDDTYVIMDNLKYMLSNYSSSEAVYFGCMPDDYPQEGLPLEAGYVLSNAALKRLVNKTHLCNSAADSHRVVMAECLKTLNIKMMDSRDSEGRGRFFPYNPPLLNLASSGASDFAISFHGITNGYLYLMEFFVYHLRAFGVVANYSNL